MLRLASAADRVRIQELMNRFMFRALNLDPKEVRCLWSLQLF